MKYRVTLEKVVMWTAVHTIEAESQEEVRELFEDGIIVPDWDTDESIVEIEIEEY